jgi:hypothetical protein
MGGQTRSIISLGAANRTEAVPSAGQLALIPWPVPAADTATALSCPRASPSALLCAYTARRRFHRHAHRRMMPHGGAGSYRP